MNFCEIVQREIGYVEFFPFCDGPSKRGEIKSVRKCPPKKAPKHPYISRRNRIPRHILLAFVGYVGYLRKIFWLADFASADRAVWSFNAWRTHPLLLGKGRFLHHPSTTFFGCNCWLFTQQKTRAKMGFPGCNWNTFQGTNISQQGKRKLIFPTTLGWDMSVFGRDIWSFPNLIWELMELVASHGPGNRRIPREGRRWFEEDVDLRCLGL